MRQINNIFDIQQVLKTHEDDINKIKSQLQAFNIPTINPNQFIILNETGANNAIAGGLPVALSVGVVVLVLLKHTLHAGANTFNAAPLKSHLNPANNIANAYSVGSIIQLVWDGTNWQDLSQ